MKIKNDNFRKLTFYTSHKTKKHKYSFTLKFNQATPPPKCDADDRPTKATRMPKRESKTHSRWRMQHKRYTQELSGGGPDSRPERKRDLFICRLTMPFLNCGGPHVATAHRKGNHTLMIYFEPFGNFKSLFNLCSLCTRL